MAVMHKNIACDMTNDMREIFIKRMKSLGIKQIDLAKKLGKSRACINMFLHQKGALTLPVLIEFCQALDLEMQILIKERGPSNVVDKTM